MGGVREEMEGGFEEGKGEGGRTWREGGGGGRRSDVGKREEGDIACVQLSG